MKIIILGSGDVARTLGTAFRKLGHDVAISSRDANKDEAQQWAKQAGGQVLSFSQIPADADFYLNCTAGTASLAALEMVSANTLKGKILIDVANPLDFSNGFPPSLSVCNTNSLGEQIQAALPDTRVVKALNTVSNPVMVNPATVPGLHHLPIAGNDAEAKAQVSELLQAFGWSREQILDLGGIEQARGTEGYLMLWVRMFGKFQTPLFNLQWQVAKEN
ncbi:hypothetical protein BTA51_09810 [Hahella sp. CCB-MM4]|uniref:NADPH-dependent F420 reductase n=1 Tax=Hahella sp. (strain CCB-MM4) TaxID=1926491 RepID=UPI000B9BF9B7|nr:NAD(P)-binding domain-containing protein [Hahella sp. CCB-MM4]OZG74057.1 hypothetical protein BTA51_09810 [Hahella sp. CCB-MM4]